eukprot:g2011.t1
MVRSLSTCWEGNLVNDEAPDPLTHPVSVNLNSDDSIGSGLPQSNVLTLPDGCIVTSIGPSLILLQPPSENQQTTKEIFQEENTTQSTATAVKNEYKNTKAVNSKTSLPFQSPHVLDRLEFESSIEKLSTIAKSRVLVLATYEKIYFIHIDATASGESKVKKKLVIMKHFTKNWYPERMNQSSNDTEYFLDTDSEGSDDETCTNNNDKNTSADGVVNSDGMNKNDSGCVDRMDNDYTLGDELIYIPSEIDLFLDGDGSGQQNPSSSLGKEEEEEAKKDETRNKYFPFFLYSRSAHTCFVYRYYFSSQPSCQSSYEKRKDEEKKRNSLEEKRGSSENERVKVEKEENVSVDFRFEWCGAIDLMKVFGTSMRTYRVHDWASKAKVNIQRRLKMSQSTSMTAKKNVDKNITPRDDELPVLKEENESKGSADNDLSMTEDDDFVIIETYTLALSLVPLLPTQCIALETAIIPLTLEYPLGVIEMFFLGKKFKTISSSSSSKDVIEREYRNGTDQGVEGDMGAYEGRNKNRHQNKKQVSSHHENRLSPVNIIAHGYRCDVFFLAPPTKMNCVIATGDSPHECHQGCFVFSLSSSYFTIVSRHGHIWLLTIENKKDDGQQSITSQLLEVFEKILREKKEWLPLSFSLSRPFYLHNVIHDSANMNITLYTWPELSTHRLHGRRQYNQPYCPTPNATIDDGNTLSKFQKRIGNATTVTSMLFDSPTTPPPSVPLQSNNTSSKATTSTTKGEITLPGNNSSRTTNFLPWSSTFKIEARRSSYENTILNEQRQRREEISAAIPPSLPMSVLDSWMTGKNPTRKIRSCLFSAHVFQSSSVVPLHSLLLIPDPDTVLLISLFDGTVRKFNIPAFGAMTINDHILQEQIFSRTEAQRVLTQNRVLTFTPPKSYNWQWTYCSHSQTLLGLSSKRFMLRALAPGQFRDGRWLLDDQWKGSDEHGLFDHFARLPTSSRKHFVEVVSQLLTVSALPAALVSSHLQLQKATSVPIPTKKKKAGHQKEKYQYLLELAIKNFQGVNMEYERTADTLQQRNTTTMNSSVSAAAPTTASISTVKGGGEIQHQDSVTFNKETYGGLPTGSGLESSMLERRLAPLLHWAAYLPPDMEALLEKRYQRRKMMKKKEAL